MRVLTENIFYFTLLFLLISCSNDDNNIESNPIILQGVFIDSPVEGLTYISNNQSGVTDSEGSFNYIEGNTITFSVGGIDLGTTKAKAKITPLDISDENNATISSQKVRNIASFLQSLDSDGNADNGITISNVTVASLKGLSLDFNSDNFLKELTDIITIVNTNNNSNLNVVSGNEAAKHLANTLNLNDEFKILPRVVNGREWEEGEYFQYNGSGINGNEYMFKIGSGLEGVRYNLGSNFGFYMNMTYQSNRLIGNGNIYNDLNANPPVEPSTVYEYRNRITSPGVVFDYGGRTFLGYYNYYKKDGNLSELEGTYEYYFFYEQKRTGQSESISFVGKAEKIITKNTSDDNFTMLTKRYDKDDNVFEEASITINKEIIDNENIILVRFQDTDYLFADKSIIEGNAQYFFGLFTVKK